MKIQEMKAEYRIQEMQKMIRARTESGLTVSEWCQENNFSEGSYYYWLKKIRERTIEEVETGNEIVQVPIKWLLHDGFFLFPSYGRLLCYFSILSRYSSKQSPCSYISVAASTPTYR